MKESWTPGPWVLTDVRGVYTISTLTSNLILELKLKSAEGAVDYDANARLIAAAPLLADLLSRALDRFTDNDMVPGNHALQTWINEAVAALAKAKGG